MHANAPARGRIDIHMHKYINSSTHMYLRIRVGAHVCAYLGKR